MCGAVSIPLHPTVRVMMFTVLSGRKQTCRIHGLTQAGKGSRERAHPPHSSLSREGAKHGRVKRTHIFARRASEQHRPLSSGQTMMPGVLL